MTSLSWRRCRFPGYFSVHVISVVGWGKDASQGQYLCAILSENIDELGYVRVAFYAFNVESQVRGLACRTAEARGDSTGAVLGPVMQHTSTVVSAIRMWLGNELNFVDPVLSGSTVGPFVSTVPVALLFVLSFTVPWLEVPSTLGVFCVALPSSWSFTPDGTYDSVWDCVMPMIGRYTILYFLYHGDVEFVCLLNDWNASSTKLLFPVQVGRPVSHWEVEVYLYGDMTIPVVVSVSDASRTGMCHRLSSSPELMDIPVAVRHWGFHQGVLAMNGGRSSSHR